MNDYMPHDKQDADEIAPEIDEEEEFIEGDQLLERLEESDEPTE